MSGSASGGSGPAAVFSMTGFGRWEGEEGGTRLAWELRSVNGKGLDLKLRLPQGYEAIEIEVRRHLAARFSRGSIQASLQLVRPAVDAGFVVNRVLLDELTAIAGELVRTGHAALPTADGLLALRGVLEAREAGPGAVPDETAHRAALHGLALASDALAAARGREGAALAAVLSGKLGEIESLASAASGDPARRPERIAERLRAQVAALVPDAPGVDPQRLAQEVALLATRADIAEELDRLATHLAAARELLAAGGPVGRRLDFLAQEFNRESNTICSKSDAASLTAIGVDLKVAVDQFREQVQNIE